MPVKEQVSRVLSGDTDDEFASRWPVLAERGCTSFILRRGAAWAVLTLGLSWLFNWAVGWDFYPGSGRMPAIVLLFQSISFLMIGVLLALVTWSANKRRYTQMTDRED